VWLSWYTYDTERPDQSVPSNLGDPGHRWLNAAGKYVDNQAVLDIHVSEGSVFDSSTPRTSEKIDGTII